MEDGVKYFRLKGDVPRDSTIKIRISGDDKRRFAAHVSKKNRIFGTSFTVSDYLIDMIRKEVSDG